MKALSYIAFLIRQTKIQNRLFVSFAILSFVPLLITGMFAYWQSSAAVKEKISTYSVQVMNQVGENIENELRRIENDSVDIAFSDLVQDALLRYPELDEWEKKNIEHQLHDMLVKKFSFFHGVSDVLVYTMNYEKITAYGDVNFQFRLKDEFLYGFLDKARLNNGIPLWAVEGPEHETSTNKDYRMSYYGKNGILLGRSLKSLQQGLPIGYMIIRLDERYILRKYEQIQLGSGADIFIVDGSGTVISSRNEEVQVAGLYGDLALIERLKTYRESGIHSFPHALSGKRCLIAYSYLPIADWYVVSTIPFSYLNDQPFRIGLYIAILGILCFLLSLLLSFIVSKSISKPLQKLVSSMNHLKKGKLSVRIEDRGSDELGVVAANFNDMVSELRFLIEEVRRKEHLKRIAELKTLQAQINPHFLSNTLNTVRWLANIQKAENIASIMDSLVRLLHGAMGKGEELVTVREEISYVKHYLNIMAYRYYDKFHVGFHLEERILDCKILKFIVQPIVENCLLHGLEPSEGQGLIVIKGYLDGDKLRISVTDNGVGMTPDMLDNLLGTNREHGKNIQLSGMGIRNVDERIKLYFGEQYGVSIQSVPNVFTTVDIIIPANIEEVA